MKTFLLELLVESLSQITCKSTRLQFLLLTKLSQTNKKFLTVKNILIVQ